MVEDVVNRVGVDVNTASASLLGYVSGITPSVAKNIVAYREENGAFTDRRQLKKVPKLGPKAYLNAAGFLRISGGKNPLDATSVHPESYEVATAVLERAGVAASELSRGGVPDIERRLGSISALASDLDCGTLTLIDIVNELKKPGRDPRDDAPEVVFSRSALSIDDLEPGMELKGTVRNVSTLAPSSTWACTRTASCTSPSWPTASSSTPATWCASVTRSRCGLKRSIATARRSPSPWCRGSKPPSKGPPSRDVQNREYSANSTVPDAPQRRKSKKQPPVLASSEPNGGCSMLHPAGKSLYLAEYSQFCTAQAGVPVARADVV